jgi:hypothetical protein
VWQQWKNGDAEYVWNYDTSEWDLTDGLVEHNGKYGYMEMRPVLISGKHR